MVSGDWARQLKEYNEGKLGKWQIPLRRKGLLCPALFFHSGQAEPECKLSTSAAGIGKYAATATASDNI